MMDIESGAIVERFGPNNSYKRNQILPQNPTPEFINPPSKEDEIHQGVTVTWSDIIYAVPNKKGDGVIRLLDNLYGEALPAELLAVMGTSGAGKSTLLDVIAGRLNSKYLKGIISANGTTINKTEFRKESGYVMQSDALFPLLTVKETFRFAAYLRISNRTTLQKRDIADHMIELLQLQRCADTVIGNDKVRGISGGEKRRVSIGVDIIHQPSVIFLDEPTSGLDSSTAYSVVESLKKMAIRKHCTIMMTIHQPSARLYELIDKVTFLSRGQTTYFGSAHGVQNFIMKIHKELNLGIPRQANAPELFLDLCDHLQQSDKIQVLTSRFIQNESKNLQPVIVMPGVLARGSRSMSMANFREVGTTNFANSLVGDVIILSQRALTNILRTKELFLARFGSTIFFSVLAGTLFLNPRNDSEGIAIKASYFILGLAYFYWTSLEALPIFFDEREIFQREFSGGSYRALSYTISSSIIYFPFLFMLALVFVSISWFLVNLPNDLFRFLFQVLLMFVVLVSGTNFSTMISVIAPDPMTGQTIGSAIFSIMFLFSGFFIKANLIPSYWIFFHYSSLFKYGMDSELVNGFQGYAHTDTMTSEDILKGYSVGNWNKWLGVGILIAWTIVYRIVFYFRLLTAFNGSRKG